MNLLITGADGQLGSELKKLIGDYSYNGIFKKEIELDITNIEAVKSIASSNKLDFIINCAAYTAVDKAEIEKEKAHLVNVIGSQNLAQVSKTFNVKLIHISTDYVFDGAQSFPYKENDTANPLSVYGKTKLDGEKEVLKITEKSCVIRSSWLYSSYGNNFVKKIINLAGHNQSINIVDDQIGTPTYVKDLAKTIYDILPVIDMTASRIYHYSNEGSASWYDFAKAIVEMAEIKCEVFPIKTKDYKTPAARPYFSVLNKEKIKKDFGIKIPYWRESLKECINILKIEGYI